MQRGRRDLPVQARQAHRQGIHLRLALTLVFGIACALVAPTASAYCRTTTCDADDPSCDRNADGCVRDGAPARWRDGPIPFRFAEGTPETVKSSFERALARWSGAQCPGTQDARAGRTGLRFVELDPMSDEGAAFVVAIEDDVSKRDELGLTTLDFGESTGTVKSGRIRIDRSALDGGVDLDIVLMHEVGHYVGLAHSRAEDSVMQEAYSSIRTPKLGPDDLKAVCTLYPPQTLRQLPPSCSAGPAGAGRSTLWFVLVAMVLLRSSRRLLLRRSRMRPRQ